MGIRSYIRDRKQVKASRATESGIPASNNTSDWDAPIKHDPAVYENYMKNAAAERKAKREKAEAPYKPATVEKAPRSDDSRMRYLGDD